MTASTDKGSDQPTPRGEGDEVYRDDQEFEDDLKELVERLVRRSRPQRPVVREGAAEEKAAGDTAATEKTAGEKTAAEKAAAPPEAEKAAVLPEADEAAVLPEPDDAQPDDEPAESSKVQDAPAEPASDEAGDSAGEAVRKKGTEDLQDAPASRGWRTVAISLAAVTAVLVIGAATLSVLLVRSATSTDARQKVAERAGFIATSLYNYDYGHVDAFLKRQTSLMTTSLAASVKQTQPTLASVITDSKVAYSSRVTQVYVSDVHGSKATAIVVMNSKVNTTKGTANVTDWYVQIQLTKQKGQWLVAPAPLSLAQGSQVDTDPKGNPLPPTSSPAPSPTPSH